MSGCLGNNDERSRLYEYPPTPLYDGLEEGNEAEATARVLPWLREITPEVSVVLYMQMTHDLNKTYSIVKSIFSTLGVQKVEIRDISLLVDALGRILNANLEQSKVPTIFVAGIYIGGVEECVKFHSSGNLNKLVLGLPWGSGCQNCGDFRYTLRFKPKEKLIPCFFCHSNPHCRRGLKSVTELNETKLHICLEAKDPQGKHVYLIYSVKGTHLAVQGSCPPAIRREAVIRGYPSMGCGVYGSKIVFAGGATKSHRCKYNGCVTFDMNDNKVDYNPFLPMEVGKLKPLVFQLNKRLYVLDSEFSYHKDRHQFFSPSLKIRWRNLFFHPKKPSTSDLLSYSCLVMGNTCFLSVPNDPVTHIHHCNYIHDDTEIHIQESLPFPGVATFYHQRGFDDFVVIYFKNGEVEASIFDFLAFQKPEHLFKVDSDSGGEDTHGHFADFGNGFFSLNAFNKSSFSITTFKITRLGKHSDPLQVDVSILSHYNIDFDCFSTKGNIESVVGCFPPRLNEEAKSCAESIVDRTLFERSLKIEDDLDVYGDPSAFKNMVLQDKRVYVESESDSDDSESDSDESDSDSDEGDDCVESE